MTVLPTPPGGLRLIIAGSRSITDQRAVDRGMEAVLASLGTPSEIVCGMAKGVDLMGKAWADARGIPVARFPVTKDDWDRYGKPAGPRRNRMMAVYANAALVCWDGASRGTWSMIEFMRELRKPVHMVDLIGRPCALRRSGAP